MPQHPTYDKARLLTGGQGIVDGGKLGLNNKSRKLLTQLIMMPDSQEEKLDNITIADYFKDNTEFFEVTFGLCGKRHSLLGLAVLHKSFVVTCTK